MSLVEDHKNCSPGISVTKKCQIWSCWRAARQKHPAKKAKTKNQFCWQPVEEEEETMMKHLQRAGEVIALYRRCLEVARLFPDPCGRNYLHYYVVEKFRKRSTETSPTIIGRHIKQGRNAVRRLRRSLHSRREYQHVIELAYGRKGPFKHLLREAEIEASQPPKLARPPRFMLEPLPGASGETFTLASLERFLDPSTREAAGAAASEREATEASARLQLAVLRELVPTRWVRRAKFAAPSPREEDEENEEDEEDEEDRRAWRQDWLPAPWDVDRSPPHEVHGTSRGTGAEAQTHRSGASNMAWMVNHLALIKTTFVPAVETMCADGAIGRAWRRLYASTLGEPRRRDVLRIEGAPESWRDPHVPFRSNGNLVLRFRDRVVDEIDPAGMGVRDGDEA